MIFMEAQFCAQKKGRKMRFQVESNMSGALKMLGIYEVDDKQGGLEAMARSSGYSDYAEAEAATGLRDYAVIVTSIHAEVNDFVRKDGHLVRIMEIDGPEGCYRTSDGGLIGFNEVDEDNVFLESEVYGELGENLPDAVETHE